jgi:murein DD-endopeptidase MepM/ murein hydrolase activator NlpD
MKVGCVKSNCEGPYHGYWAIDFETLANKPGAPVYAAGAGRVRVASQGTGRCGGPGTVANSLIVNHGGGVESVYVHLTDFAVADGVFVTPNTIIGRVGSSGYTDPCPDYHLHFEVRINGATVNPGQLRACHGSKLVNYPNAVGFADWNAIPAQEYAGGPPSPKGRTVYSDGTACASS